VLALLGSERCVCRSPGPALVWVVHRISSGKCSTVPFDLERADERGAQSRRLPFNSEEARGAKKLTTGLAPLKGPFIAVGPGSSDRQVSKDAAGNSLSTADGRHKPVDGC
jgi:hypothetical protein